MDGRLASCVAVLRSACGTSDAVSLKGHLRTTDDRRQTNISDTLVGTSIDQYCSNLDIATRCCRVQGRLTKRSKPCMFIEPPTQSQPYRWFSERALSLHER